MAHEFSETIERLISERMASGKYASEDDLMLDALSSLIEDEEEIRAIQEALDAIDDGEQGVPLDIAFERVRERYRRESA
jgi:Arc/MetJ-type ribon-helix-helix transcriptional regulator